MLEGSKTPNTGLRWKRLYPETGLLKGWQMGKGRNDPNPPPKSLLDSNCYEPSQDLKKISNWA